MENIMKTFLVEHNGLYFDGLSIVTAQDAIRAKKTLRPIIREEMKRLEMTGHIYMKLKEIDTKKTNAFMIDNGDD